MSACDNSFAGIVFHLLLAHQLEKKISLPPTISNHFSPYSMSNSQPLSAVGAHANLSIHVSHYNLIISA